MEIPLRVRSPSIGGVSPGSARRSHPVAQRVEGELSGGGRTLAEECYRSVTHAEQSDEVAALAALRVAAQSSISLRARVS